MLPEKRSNHLPSGYLKAAWWVYRNPLQAAGAVAGAFALAAFLGGRIGGRR